jgi:hypothetical protein
MTGLREAAFLDPTVPSGPQRECKEGQRASATSSIGLDLWTNIIGFAAMPLFYAMAFGGLHWVPGFVAAFAPGRSTLAERAISFTFAAVGLILTFGLVLFVVLALATARSLRRSIARWSLTVVRAGESPARVLWLFIGAAAIVALVSFDYRHPLAFEYSTVFQTMLRGARWYCCIAAAALTINLLRLLSAHRFALPQVSTLVPLDASIRGGFRIAHWSDLHLTRNDTERTFEGQSLGGNIVLRDLVDRKGDVLSSVDLLIVTGDITDRGLAEEWGEFFGIVPERLFNKTLIIPGNHDLNLSDLAPTVTTEGSDRVLLSLRMIRFLAAADAIQGSRVRVWRTPGQKTLREYLAPFADDLRSFYAAPPARCIKPVGGNMTPIDVTSREDDRLLRLVPSTYAGAFPMVAEFASHRLAFVLLDSNDRSANVLDNSFGVIAPEVLQVLPEIREHYESMGFGLVYLLHHHLVLPEETSTLIDKVQLRAMRLTNAAEVLAAIRSPQPAAVFHGHRHFGYSGRTGDGLQIVSAPSTTLGHEGKIKRTNGGFEMFFLDPPRVCLTRNGLYSVETTARIADPLPFVQTPFAKSLRRGALTAAALLVAVIVAVFAFHESLERWAICQPWIPEAIVGAMIDATPLDTETMEKALRANASRGSLKNVRRLLATTCGTLPDDRTLALTEAVAARHLDVVAELYAAGADVYDFDVEALRSSPHDLGFLIRMRDREGNTPLHRAILYRHRDTAVALVRAGADIYARNRDGRTPRDYAIGDPKLMSALAQPSALR